MCGERLDRSKLGSPMTDAKHGSLVRQGGWRGQSGHRPHQNGQTSGSFGQVSSGESSRCQRISRRSSIRPIVDHCSAKTRRGIRRGPRSSLRSTHSITMMSDQDWTVLDGAIKWEHSRCR